MITVVTRVRPVSVRFTDASIPDFDAELRGKPAILEAAGDGAGDAEGAATMATTAFDALDEQNRRRLAPADDEELLKILAEDEDIVRIFKQKIRASRPSLSHRRLRLIHAGRILKDGIKLVSWLDSLDAHRNAQERAANRSSGLNLGESARIALGGLRDAAERGTALDLDSITRKGRQGLGELWRRFDDGNEGRGAGPDRGEDLEAGAQGATLSAKAKGKARLIDDVDEGASSASNWGSEEDAVPRRQGPSFKVVEDRSADRVYLQCSIGDDMTPEEEAEANAPRASALPGGLRNKLNQAWSPAPASRAGEFTSSPIPSGMESPWADVDDDPFGTRSGTAWGGEPGLSASGNLELPEGERDPETGEPVPGAAPRGFDRLAATAGLSPADIEEMRAQFRLAAARGWGDGGMQGAGGPSGLGRSGDVLREAEEEEHARALEEQWIDSMGEGMEGDANRPGSGPLQARFEGLFVGFFFPFLPLFFWRDKTGHPARLPRSEFVYDPQRPGEVIRADEIDYDSEDDDDIVGPNARPNGAGAANPAIANQDARNVVFTSTMAQAIIVGLVCNCAYGALASLW
ncbi:hypothetical protein OC844_001030 [Tilletia horrida]|nr:hypothetical protein OC844_001030 [Tilletia horrida]